MLINLPRLIFTFVFAVLLFALFGIFDVYVTIASTIFFYQVIHLLMHSGQGLPARYLIGVLFSLNYLFAPILMFLWLNGYINYNYQIKGELAAYFEYAIPAILLFIAGLHWNAKRTEESIDVEKIRWVVANRPRLPMIFIVIGSIAVVAAPLMPPGMQIYMRPITYIPYIGLFLHIVTSDRLKLIYFIPTLGVTLYSSIVTSMFNDLLNIMVFVLFFLLIRFNKKKNARVIGFGIVAGIVVFVQIVKAPLRKIMWAVDAQVSAQEVYVLTGDAYNDYSSKSLSNQFAEVVFRLNQGWILSEVLLNHSRNGYELEDGKHSLAIVESAVLPRFLAPDKILVGDVRIFNKYTIKKLRIGTGTSMALGVLSDVYIDFGHYGMFLLFIYGMLFNGLIKLMHRRSKSAHIIKLFLPIVLFMSIRPDTDTQQALGSFFKVTIFIFCFYELLLILSNMTKARLNG